MFDFHIHTTVSFDGHDSALAMAQVAKAAGLREICFTDHIDEDPKGVITHQCFDLAAYSAAYDGLEVPGLTIRKGLEFGMLPGNQATLQRYLAARDFDFVLGSVHYAAGLDVYYAPYWENRTLFEGEGQYLADTLQMVREHDGYDVLAHLTYISKAHCHPAHTPVEYNRHREIVDEILKILVARGKGMEINTSGVDRCGDFLPPEVYLRRFKELGGEIVTVGSDAHTASRVGQYTDRACAILKDIFGYVCTFEGRKPVFHKL